MSRANPVWQVVIIGAGVTGLLAAVDCALAGHRVTVLDRGAIPNPESSSFDQHKAIHPFVPGDPVATGERVAAHRRWLELETLLGSRFYRRVGSVSGWPEERIGALVEEATAAGLPVAGVEPEKLPQFAFPDGTAGLLEHDAGVLLAEHILRAATRWLAAHPSVTLRPWSAVRSVDVHSGRIGLAGGAGLGADAVLVAAGPWLAELVEQPVVLHRQTMAYLRPPENLARWWESAPAGGRLGADGRAWLLPPGDGTLLKISSDVVCREVDTIATDDETLWVQQLLTASPLSDVDSYAFTAVKQCHYLAGAGDTLLARSGPAVWSRTACGGIGFCTAPLVARQFVETLRAESA